MKQETLLIVRNLLLFGLPRRARLVLALAVLALAAVTARAQVVIAQISDTHLGEEQSPCAEDNLRRAVNMINDRKPDAVVVTGDIGEGPENWQVARQILKRLRAPIYYVPGNHDVRTRNVSQYRGFFGKDYYTFQVKGVTFLVIDTQLLGNYDNFSARSPQPLPADTEAESRRMLDWLRAQAGNDSPNHRNGGPIIGIQHVPAFRDGDFPPDRRPYWEISEPYRSQEMEILHKLGIRHILAGHWHNGRVFERDGISWHVAPSTSWLPWGGELGFALHTISNDGEVKTEFVWLGTQP